MKWFSAVEDVRRFSRAARAAGRRVGLVPTMGYLHDGHLALVRALKAEADVIILSIFVNPLQFAPNEDFERYPRDMERDRRLAEEAGVDAVFAPEVSEMYPLPAETYVEIPTLSARLDGESRPTHFRGVTTVVTKLFLATEPDVAAFGQKDAQQAVIIKRMVRELLFPVRIVVVPTVREPDGLALSSRNVYLGPEERRAAPALWRALEAGETRIREGERDPAAVEAAMAGILAAEPLVRPEYARVLNLDELVPVATVSGRLLLAVAARVGPARLIDNLCLDVDGERVRPTLP